MLGLIRVEVRSVAGVTQSGAKDSVVRRCGQEPCVESERKGERVEAMATLVGVQLADTRYLNDATRHSQLLDDCSSQRPTDDLDG